MRKTIPMIEDMTDNYARQKQYLKVRYATDEAYRSNRQRQMRGVPLRTLCGGCRVQEAQRLAQLQRYAAGAAFLSVGYLFEPPPVRKRRPACSIDARLLHFCRRFLAGNDGPPRP